MGGKRNKIEKYEGKKLNKKNEQATNIDTYSEVIYDLLKIIPLKSKDIKTITYNLLKNLNLNYEQYRKFICGLLISKKNQLSYDQYIRILYGFKNSNCDSKDIETLTHYYLSEAIAGVIGDVGKSTSRKYPSVKNKDELLFMSILPLVFISTKEYSLGKKGYSFDDYLKRVDDDDLNSFLDKRDIVIINNENYKSNVQTRPIDLSNKKIIEKIRNAIAHTQYILTHNGIIVPIDNNQVFVNYKYILDFIKSTPSKWKKELYSSASIHQEDMVDIIQQKTHHNIIDKIQFKKFITKQGENGFTDNDFELTDEEQKLLKTFCEENDSIENLESVIGFVLFEPPELQMFGILKNIMRNNNNLNDFINELFLILHGDFYSIKEYMNLTDIIGKGNEEQESFINDLYENIKSKKDDSGLPLLLNGRLTYDYIIEYCKNKGLEHNDQKKCWEKKNINFEINDDLLFLWLNYLSKEYMNMYNCIKMFPNWLKIQYIKSVYLNQLLNFDKKIPGLITCINNDNSEKFTDHQHIRNALTHNWYIMLPGINKIILHDGYDKNTNSWKREATINLQELFEKTHKKMQTFFQNNI